MNTKIESLIDPTLLTAIKELAANDIIIEAALLKSSTEKECINALVAVIICVTERELANVEKINSLLKSNPEIQKMLESKNDQTMLPESNDQ